MKKHIQHKKLFHYFKYFKKAFDRVWHKGLWYVMRSFGMGERLFQIIQALCKNAASEILLNSDTGEYFRTILGVRQGCLLSPYLFNIVLVKIICKTLHIFKSTISIGGRTLSNLRLIEDISLTGGRNKEL